MKRKVAFASFLALVLVPASAVAFFGELDSLEKELDSIEETDSTSTDDLDALFDKLEDVSGESVGVQFNDVSSSDWFHQYVSSVAAKGIVSGYKDASGNSTGMYGPGDSVTIAQMLKIGIEAAGTDESKCTRKPATSGAVGHWAERYVACAELHGMRIVRDGVDINRPARRGEVLGIIHDAFGDVPAGGDSPFLDTGGHPYESDITYAYSQGTVSGDTDASGNLTGTYRPDDGVNRAEAAKIVHMRLEN